MRRLEEQGKVVISDSPPGPVAAGLAGLAIDLKRAWLEDRGLVSLALASDATRDFMAAVAGDAARPVGCHVSALTLDETPTSLQIGFLCKGHFALHVLVYALAHEKSRTGTLHLEELLRRAFKEGWQRIDLLAPKADYKMDWADGTVGMGDYAVPVTMKGRAFTRIYLGGLRRRLAEMAASGKHPWLASVISHARRLRRRESAT
jgi:CelD/BcsL family acetyltransferase involved in cellulose biosynthesis